MTDAPATPPRRSRRRRVLRVVLVGLLAVVLVVGGTATYLAVRLDKEIETIDGSGLSKHRPPPTVRGQNVLLIGSDTRGGASGALVHGGSAVGRSDTTLLVHVAESGRSAVAVSIPRDALVDVPRCRLPDGSWSAPQHDVMFNSAFQTGQSPHGNPTCTVNTVEALTGLRVDHTVVADFAGFARITEIVGGVPVCVPQDVHEGDVDPDLPAPGPVVLHAGRQELSGADALTWVRLRHGLGDGSDIGRMRRQQAFLGALMTKVRAEGLTPTKLLPLAEAATASLTVDPDLGSTRKLVGFALGLRHLTPEHVVFTTTPWRYDGARVALVHPDVDRLWTALEDDEPVPALAGRDPGSGSGSGSGRAGGLPSSITGDARTAATDPCTDTSYG